MYAGISRVYYFFFFFFKQKTAYEITYGDWSSDVCSSDLFVGVEKGIFLKHGVDVKLKILSTGQEMSKALQAGEAQLVGAAFSNFPLAVERGMTVRGKVVREALKSCASRDRIARWMDSAK